MRGYVVTLLGLGLAGALAFAAWPKPSRDTHAPTPERAPVALADDLADEPARTTATHAHLAPPQAGAPNVGPAVNELEPDLRARWLAIESMVRDGDVARLPALTSSELAKEPEVAPAIIHAVASLAVQGTDADRALAGKTLARWLREEQKRDTRDAAGNVVNIVEALGDLGGDEAVTSLIDVLDHEEDLALQATAADRLATLGDARALPAVLRWDARLARTAEPGDPFERELRAEAMKTAEGAKERLSAGRDRRIGN